MSETRAFDRCHRYLGLVLVCSTLLILAFSKRVAAQPVVFGPDTYVADTGFNGKLEAIGGSDGRFLTAWAEQRDDINCRLYDHTGLPAGPLVVVGTRDHTGRTRPLLASLPAGYLVVWDDGNQRLLGRRLDLDGQPLSPAAQMTDTFYTDDFDESSVATAPDGSAVLVWPDWDEIRARQVDSSGAAIAPGFVVNNVPASEKHQPEVAVQSDGSFLIVWTEHDRDSEGRAIVGRVYDSAGSPAGPDFVVNLSTAGSQFDPEVAALGTIDWIVVWAEGQAIRALRLDGNGAPIGSELTLASGSVSDPSIARMADDSFIAAWRDSSGPALGTRMTRLDATGLPSGITQGVEKSRIGLLDLGVRGLTGGGVLVRSRNTDRSGLFVNVACVDSTSDLDGDGIGDSCDPCTNSGGREIAFTTRAQFKRLEPAPKLWDGNDIVKLRGGFDLVGFDFSAVDPLTSPVELRLLGPDGGTVLQFILPPVALTNGLGWEVNADGTKWTFTNLTDESLNGFRSLILRDRSSKAPGRVELKAYGIGGFYPFFAGDEPIQYTISLGDSVGGFCGETVFETADCRFDTSGSRLACKR